MRRLLKLLGLSLLVLLGGCGLLGKDMRTQQFAQSPSPSSATLVLIGGNSECTADKGIWLLRPTITDDIAAGLGVDKSTMSLHYFGWTGDLPGTGGCLPETWDYVHGQDAILRALELDPLLYTKPLIVVGWSNGGATANQLAALISSDKKPRGVDLLVTLDPVSFFSKRQEPSKSTVWQNVYIRSKSFWSKFNDFGNFYSGIGGAWDDFGPASQPCIEANHGDVWLMWNEVIRQDKFGSWVAKNRITSPTARVATPHKNPDPQPGEDVVDKGSTKCRP